MSNYGPNIDDCTYDEDVGAYYDSESGSYYSEDDDYDLFGAGYDDDDLFDATADLLSNHPEKRRSHAEMDDTFKMDVIDLD